jgi:hypothetical protein
MVLSLSFSDSAEFILPLPSTEIVPAVICYLPVNLAWSLLFRTLITFFYGHLPNDSLQNCWNIFSFILIL